MHSPVIEHWVSQKVDSSEVTYRESLRDGEACVGAMPEKLYHMGIRSRIPSRNYRGHNRLE